MKSNLFVQAAIAAVVFVVAGCDKEAEKVQLQTPVPEASVEATSVECTVSWANVENAVSYSWKLYETAEPTVAVAEDAAYVGDFKKFTDLKEDTEYVFAITAVAAPETNYLNSEEAKVTFKTGVIPRAESPVFRTNAVTDVGVSVTWSVVEGAAYKYRIVAKDAPDKNLNSDADKTFKDPFVTLAGLTASTSYIIYVQTIPSAESGLVASNEAAFEFTTEAAATTPWVAVAFEYRVFAEKNTLIIHNVPNSQAANYYTTTENVNVIGGGHDTESAFSEYVIECYDYHEAGTYANTSIHKFNNLGQGWKAGNNLFYGAVAEDKKGNTKLNWFWLEMPENPGDDVKILDSPKK